MIGKSSASSDRLLRIRQYLADYPILSSRIRALMRTELFNRGIIRAEEFEEEAQKLAVESQAREGVIYPKLEESNGVWELRLERMRDNLTDLRFSQNLSFEIFEGIVSEVLSKRGVNVKELMMTMNIELAPMELVFEHAMHIEAMTPEERAPVEHRLEEATVVLIRTLISDQLPYINIAKQWFTTSDLARIREHKISPGRIGGKAAGMLLAARILSEMGSPELKACVRTPLSYYIGSGELYTFMSINNLGHWNNQKYKNEQQMREEYPQIVADFEKGSFASDTLEKLRIMLENIGQKPVIVRSSSLLEDSFGTSFAGKYESIFLPNQGTQEENFRALIKAMARIYASTLNPSALIYRRSKGLDNYDERMALLIQEVQGEKFGQYYLPYAAGVGFSRNLYRWNPQIRREDGFVRLVWGLGTRAVDRVGNDYPRLIALSHPLLRPSPDHKAIRRYSQQYVDLIDLKSNKIETLPIHDVLEARYPNLRYLAQMDEGGYFSSLRSSIMDGDKRNLVLTFDELLKRTPFAERMREILSILEKVYNFPVDIEFTVDLERQENGEPQLNITLLQCRPQSHLLPTEQVHMPVGLHNKDIIFSTNFTVPEGYIEKVNHVIFVPPEGYFALPTAHARCELGRVIGRLNKQLAGECFILVGPGRWGSSNSDLGVPIDYGDIFNGRALVELTGRGIGPAPEPSLGTHFFQDLMEAQIYPLGIYLDDPKTVFHRKFFYNAPNRLAEYLPDDADMESCLRVIRVSDYRPDHTLKIIMSDAKSQAVAFLTPLQ